MRTLRQTGQQVAPTRACVRLADAKCSVCPAWVVSPAAQDMPKLFGPSSPLVLLGLSVPQWYESSGWVQKTTGAHWGVVHLVFTATTAGQAMLAE